jgi:DNA (cytosine-5)-methyltransferase 1
VLPKLERPTDGTAFSSSHGLPTPQGSDHKGTAGTAGRVRKSRDKPYNPGDRDLPEAVQLLPTPRVQGGGGGAGMDGRFLDERTTRKEGMNLSTAMLLLYTPAARDWKGRESRGHSITNDVYHLARSWGPYEPAIRRWERVTGYPAPPPLEVAPRGIYGRLNPAFSEWMMGVKPGYITGVPGLNRRQVLQAIGNGCVPQQAMLALKIISADLRREREEHDK